MKRFFFCYIILLFCSCQDDLIEGVTVIDLGQSGDFTDICITNQNEIIALGGHPWEFSFLASSTDNGDHWQVDSLTDKILFDIDAFNSDLYSGGLDGQIHQKTDNQWNFIRTTEWGFIKGLQVLPDQSIITLGGHAYRLGFINKINTDQSIERLYTEDIEFSDIEITPNGNLVAAAYGKILYSQDEGRTWLISNGTGDFFKDLVLMNDAILAIGNNGLILRSFDQGLSWEPSRKLGDVARSDRLQKGVYLGDDVIWVVGRSGLVVISEDAGNTWAESRIDTSFDLTAIEKTDSNVFVGGTDGFFCVINR